MNGRPFSELDQELVKQNYQTKGCRWCASQIGRSMTSVYQLAAKLNLTKQRECLSNAVIIDAIRELHPKGLSDTEIVKHLTELHGLCTDRHRVSVLRRKLDLASNALSEHRRKIVREKTKLQLESSGFQNLSRSVERLEAIAWMARGVDGSSCSGTGVLLAARARHADHSFTAL